jgi:hypothetical protein
VPGDERAIPVDLVVLDALGCGNRRVENSLVGNIADQVVPFRELAVDARAFGGLEFRPS